MLASRSFIRDGLACNFTVWELIVMIRQRGYFGIGIYHPKFDVNVGGLWRSAHAFGASFIFTIGARYKQQPTDTSKAPRHIPLYEYKNLKNFNANKPRDCSVVGIEIDERSVSLTEFVHPIRAIYLLGAEDIGLDVAARYCDSLVEIPSVYCLNVATAGAIAIYDRVLGR